MKEPLDHNPTALERDDAEAMVVFIHGIMGSPRQFLPYMDRVSAEGYSVAAPLLPGHGGRGAAFAKTGLAAWEAHIDEVLRGYAARYERIIVVGHSMGGLLGLNASLEPSLHIAGVFMIAPPIRLNLSPRSIALRVALALSPKNRQMWDRYMTVCGVDAPIVQYATWLRPFASLKRLIEKTKRNLSRITVPVFFVHSRADESVAFRSSDYLVARLAKSRHDRLQLSDSWHAYFTEADNAQINEKLLAFLREALD